MTPSLTQPSLTQTSLTQTSAAASSNDNSSDVPLDPAWPKQLFVVADSVMLGAKLYLFKGLADWKVTFYGKVSLVIPTAVGELRQQRAPLGPVAVVALGYNSNWQRNRLNYQHWADQFDRDVENMLAVLKARGVRKVVWVLLREMNPGLPAAEQHHYAWYFPYVNERLRVAKVRHPELTLADWTTAARGRGLTADGIHLTATGGALMVEVVKTAIGIDVRPAAPAQVTAPANVTVASASPQPLDREPPIVPAVRAQPMQKASPKPAAQVASVPALSGSPADAKSSRQPSYAFRDCPACPEMVVVPAASFLMGSSTTETDRNDNEGPQRQVTIARPFAIGKFEVTFAEWQACVAGGGCQSNPNPDDEGWGKDRQPVVNVSWDDAMEYVAWLSKTTGKTYRLLTEAEWEYAARAGTTSRFAIGNTISSAQANFQTNFNEDGSSRVGEYREQAVKVGSFAANAWGLHDMHGNVREWVQDNWHDDYSGVTTDGSSGPGGDTSARVLRGGSWYSLSPDVRSASRHRDLPDYRSGDVGFRVARSL